MIYTVDEIQKTVRPIAEKYCLPAVYLFGSYARGTASENSDVDILGDTTGTQLKSLFSLGALYNDREEAFGKRIDLITVNPIFQRCQLPSEETFRDTLWKEKIMISD